MTEVILWILKVLLSRPEVHLKETTVGLVLKLNWVCKYRILKLGFYGAWYSHWKMILKEVFARQWIPFLPALFQPGGEQRVSFTFIRCQKNFFFFFFQHLLELLRPDFLFFLWFTLGHRVKLFFPPCLAFGLLLSNRSHEVYFQHTESL